MDIEIKQEPPIDLDSSFEIAGNSETQNASIHVQDTEQASCSKKRKLSDDYYTPAEINPDNEMQFLLKEWGLEVLSESFAKNLIDVDVLDYILDVDIIDLCRDYPLRYRVVLRHKIKQKSYKRDKEPDQLQRKSAHRKERQTNTLAPQSASESTNELMVPMGSCPSASSGKPSTASLKARSETERQYSLSSSLDDSAVFWKKLKAEYGIIDLHLKNILKIQNLCSQSLGKLTRDGIMRIAADMRSMARCFTEEAHAGGTPLHELYGRKYANEPEKFEFLEGEILCLLDLAEIVRSKGMKRLLKSTTGSSSDSASNVLVNETDDSQLRSRLCDKIMRYFSSQDVKDPVYDAFLVKLRNMSIKILTAGSGKYRAEIQCPVCEENGGRPRISLSTDNRGTWHIYGLTRHCSTRHFKLPPCSNRRRRQISTPNVTNQALQVLQDSLTDSITDDMIEYEYIDECDNNSEGDMDPILFENTDSMLTYSGNEDSNPVFTSQDAVDSEQE